MTLRSTSMRWRCPDCQRGFVMGDDFRVRVGDCPGPHLCGITPHVPHSVVEAVLCPDCGVEMETRLEPQP